jgi:general secretion pathway protein E
MVGEIRDLETAQIAVQASLTGHVVLSTLHTNSSIGAVTRLRDMGTEPFLLASSLVGVLAQRLVRVLCVHCKTPLPPGSTTAAFFGPVFDGTEANVQQTAGCPACHGIGFRGRTAIYELAAFDERMRELVHDGAAEHELARTAFAHTETLLDSGRRKVAMGVTTIEEVTRVTQAS